MDAEPTEEMLFIVQLKNLVTHGEKCHKIMVSTELSLVDILSDLLMLNEKNYYTNDKSEIMMCYYYKSRKMLQHTHHIYSYSIMKIIIINT